MKKFYYYLAVFIITIIAIIVTSIATAQNNYLQQGKTYYNRGQYDRAIEVWQEEIERNIDILPSSETRDS